ncbi:MAG: hypothetical protein JWP36_564 [Paucimonas sp.]|jgi:Tfp pilus assembly protein PilE|nr:hypothetical protein [Paucimonas sp.]
MRLRSKSSQAGLSLSGLIQVLVIVGILAAFGLRILPSVIEYFDAKHSLAQAKADARSAADIRESFDKRAEVSGIESVKGKDLTITRNGDNWDAGFAYERRFSIAGPVSLVILYEASTGPTGKVKAN